MFRYRSFRSSCGKGKRRGVMPFNFVICQAALPPFAPRRFASDDTPPLNGGKARRFNRASGIEVVHVYRYGGHHFAPELRPSAAWIVFLACCQLRHLFSFASGHFVFSHDFTKSSSPIVVVLPAFAFITQASHFLRRNGFAPPHPGHGVMAFLSRLGPCWHRCRLR